jgi:hypothetical protein
MMDRLPDVPYGVELEEQERRHDKEDPSYWGRIRKNLGGYGLLLLVCLALFFIMATEPVAFDEMTVEDIQVVQNETAEGIFVVGSLNEGVGRFSDADVSFDEETGVAEVQINRYQITTFFGSQEFVAYIEGDPYSIKEIWLVNDGKGNVERMQLDYGVTVIVD